jgi:hypothetical protein
VVSRTKERTNVSFLRVLHVRNHQLCEAISNTIIHP